MSQSLALETEVFSVKISIIQHLVWAVERLVWGRLFRAFDASFRVVVLLRLRNPIPRLTFACFYVFLMWLGDSERVGTTA